jgi:carbon-monoxide dehydrogenase iron sulfur subunit
MVCPFGVIAREEERKVALKCDRCPDRDVPACVEACPTRSLIFTEVERAEKSRRKKFLESVVLDSSQ